MFARKAHADDHAGWVDRIGSCRRKSPRAIALFLMLALAACGKSPEEASEDSPKKQAAMIRECFRPLPDITMAEWLISRQAVALAHPDEIANFEVEIDEKKWTKLPERVKRQFAPMPESGDCLDVQIGAQSSSAADGTPPRIAAMKSEASASHAADAPSCTSAPEVDVKYRGPVSLAPFQCQPITRSSFIECVCYDAANAYMLVNLNGTWYHYCEIDRDTVSALLGAESMGRYYNASIKGRFDCRTHRVPAY